MIVLFYIFNLLIQVCIQCWHIILLLFRKDLKHKCGSAQTFTKCKLVELLLPKVGHKILYIVIKQYIEYNGLVILRLLFFFSNT